MPLTIEHPLAAISTGRKYRRYFSEAERIFDFNLQPVDFISNGLIGNDQFTSTLDGDPIIRRFLNMTINEGHTVTPTLRCKGMYLLIEGDLIIDGTLSMTARGANAPGKFVGIDPDNENVYFNETDIFSQDIFTIGKVGGVTPTTVNAVGANGVNNACAGGGGGAIEYSVGGRQGYGGPGTSFSGGAAGGASARYTAGNAAIDGGRGGAGVSHWSSPLWWTAGGGAGNPGGAGGTGGGAGQNGTGGLMILIVKGNIIFGPNGKIISAGSKGGYGYDAGGGSGGGAIHVFHKGTISNPEKVTAPGGVSGDRVPTGGYAGVFGRTGGNGSISFNKF